ncbi:hypothetical protein J6590_008926 [Homalodisca vitripennis]|nr:hypothetical protein J6590_008926 [Homalodisca vitripennis]
MAERGRAIASHTVPLSLHISHVHSYLTPDIVVPRTYVKHGRAWERRSPTPCDYTSLVKIIAKKDTNSRPRPHSGLELLVQFTYVIMSWTQIRYIATARVACRWNETRITVSEEEGLVSGQRILGRDSLQTHHCANSGISCRNSVHCATEITERDHRKLVLNCYGSCKWEAGLWAVRDLVLRVVVYSVT